MIGSMPNLLAQRYFPVLAWCKHYNPRHQLLRDLVSGITVGFMTVPQALSYAAVAGLPAERGLYSALLAMVLYAVLGTSPHLICGPTAVMAIMVRSSIPEEWQDVELHATDAVMPGGVPSNGSAQWRGLAPAPDPQDAHTFSTGQEAFVDAASMLTFFAGALQLLIGAGGAGFVFQLISTPVVAGFTSAAALLIVSTQLTTALGLPKCTTNTDSRCSFFQNLAHVLGSLPQAQGAVVGGTAACLAVLLLFKYALRPRLQGAWKPLGNMGPIVILAIFTPVYYVYQARMQEAGLRAVGHVPSGLPVPEAPFRAPSAWRSVSDGQNFLSADAVLALLPGALGMAAVGFLEANAISRVVARRTGTPSPAAAAELRALGVANCATACFRGFAVTGSFSRTAVNVDAGASSGVSGAVAAVVVAAVCLLLTPALAYLPMVCLAAIILTAVVNLLEVKEAVAFFRTSAREFTVFCVVFLSVLAVGVEAGLAVGIMCSWALTLSSQQWEHTPGVLLAKETGTTQWQDTAHATDAQYVQRAHKLLILAVQGDISFAGAEVLQGGVQEGVGVFTPQVVVLDVTASSRCDTSGVLALHSLASALKVEGCVHLILGGMSAGLAGAIGRVLSAHLPAAAEDKWREAASSQCSTAGVQATLLQHGLLALPNVRSALAVAAVMLKSPPLAEAAAPPTKEAVEHSIVPRDALLVRHWAKCRAEWLRAMGNAAHAGATLQGLANRPAPADVLASPRARRLGTQPAVLTASTAGCPQVLRRIARQAQSVCACGGASGGGSGASEGLLSGPGPRPRFQPDRFARQEGEGPDDCLVHLGPAPEPWLQDVVCGSAV